MHWDHIHGLPYFYPAYVPGSRIIIHSAHKDFDRQLALQQTGPHFPVHLAKMGATFQFGLLREEKTVQLSDCKISLFKQQHPAGCYSYRLDDGRAVIVYATDAEHQDLGQDNL